jgi:predicted nuclease of predicted toxin-antitoxin system
VRFLVDESTGPAVARWLRDTAGHDVASVYDEMRGADDEAVISRAHAEQRILVTNDKDFGEKVYRDGRAHAGVVLLRLRDERTPIKLAVVRVLLGGYAERLAGSFVVATEHNVRFARWNQ